MVLGSKGRIYMYGRFTSVNPWFIFMGAKMSLNIQKKSHRSYSLGIFFFGGEMIDESFLKSIEDLLN